MKPRSAEGRHRSRAARDAKTCNARSSTGRHAPQASAPMARNADLKACGRLYSEMESAVLNAVRGLTDQQAESLRRCIANLNQVNCWWAEYRVAPIIRIALVERRRERRSVGRKLRRRATNRPADSRADRG